MSYSVSKYESRYFDRYAANDIGVTACSANFDRKSDFTGKTVVRRGDFLLPKVVGFELPNCYHKFFEF